MQRRHGDMLAYAATHPADGYCITTNSFIKADKTLTMGRGIAQTVRDTYPGFAAQAGALVLKRCGHLGEYNLLRVPRRLNIALFQVKFNFADNADVQLIGRSTAALRAVAERHPQQQYHLNFPGIGNGRLTPEQVLPLIQSLPDNVTVWEL